VRGYRIELGEVEAALRSQEWVREAVVIAREEAGGGQRLVAYVVRGEGAGEEVGPGELREGLRARLPEYMVPAAFVMLEELPLTPNGKVDRKALPAPDELRLETIESFIRPRDMVEFQLVRLWEELLGVHPIGVTDNFFELGGHSLLAVKVISRIQQQLGKKLPLAAVFQKATIEHLAMLLRQCEGVVRTSPLVQLHGGSKLPLIFVHPAGGSIFHYLNLVQYLDPDQPLYALQAAGLDEDQPVQETVETMAADYISAIREAGLQGPYLLGGWSMGGVVAFEMARQLQAEDEEVALLSLIDSADPLDDAQAEVDDVALLIGFAQDIGLRAEHVDVSMEQLLELTLADQLAFILSRAKKEYLVPPEVEVADIFRYFSVYRTNIRAMSTYVPQPQRVNLALFKADEQLAQSAPGETMGWGELAGEEVEVCVVPGNHYTLLREPHVRILAEHLQTCINKAEKLACV
jgi:thioesterase domain-containing protein